MLMSRTFVAALAAAGAAAAPIEAQQIQWPAELKASLDGVWLAENNAMSIEIRKGEVFVRSISQFGRGGVLGDALNKQVAVIGNLRPPRSETWRVFDASCKDASSSWAPYACDLRVNRVATGRRFPIITFSGTNFYPEKDMSAKDREYRLRKPS